jgi:hypothetical protein
MEEDEGEKKRKELKQDDEVDAMTDDDNGNSLEDSCEKRKSCYSNLDDDNGLKKESFS